jgi:hypothetical protein
MVRENRENKGIRELEGKPTETERKFKGNKQKT